MENLPLGEAMGRYDASQIELGTMGKLTFLKKSTEIDIKIHLRNSSGVGNKLKILTYVSKRLVCNQGEKRDHTLQLSILSFL